MRPFLLILTLLTLHYKSVNAQLNIYHEGWTDFNKNGKKDVYEDSKQPVEKKGTTLYER